MRILHVIARMNVGGTATYLSGLISGQLVKGNEVLLLTGSVPNGESEDPILEKLPYLKVQPLSRKISILGDWRAQRQIKKIIKTYKPDLVHTHTFKAGLLVRLLNLKIPVVHSFHGHHLVDPEFGFIKITFLNLIEKYLCKRSSALIATGDKVRQELIEVGVGKSVEFFSIPPGIEELELLNSDEVRRRLNLNLSDFIVMWLGRFTMVKRPDLVVEVAGLLPDITFVMAGGGELFEAIKAIAPKNVVLCGYRDKKEMWAISDLALCTSDSEGMPLALIEAQMAGVPVVSTDVGSISEILENGVTGVLTSNTASALSQAVELLASSSAKRREMGAAAKTRAKRLFSEEVMVSAHQDLYERVLKGVNK